MADSFEASIDGYLARIFVDNLRAAIEEAGFREAVRIPEPDITEYQRDHHVISLRTGHATPQKWQVTLEGESLEVGLFVEKAATATIVEVWNEMLGAVPWLDHITVRPRFESAVADLIEQMRANS